MSDISPSIWNQDNNGEWKLYFNTDSDISSPSQKNKEEQKIKKSLNTSDKNLVLGTLVMTPQGIGRLIKSADGIAHIRFNQEIKEHQFKINEISSTFNCYISFINNGNIDIIRLKLKVSGNVENIFEELIKLKKINPLSNNYSLIYNSSLLKNESTFEQLKLKNNTKILILEITELENKICRFPAVNKYWYSYRQDGICFSPSENIKLLGIGLYCPHDNVAVMNGVVKIIEGQSFYGKVIQEENAEIPVSTNQLNPSTKIKFSKSITCKKNMDYSIIFCSDIETNTFSGFKGKAIVEGDKGIIFTFKKLLGNKGGSSIEVGNFPEIYYCLK